ncbi:MAG: hypothetical protein ACI9JN_001147 [Bacteroidia bacterium]|jgi:hypothetical protein
MKIQGTILLGVIALWSFSACENNESADSNNEGGVEVQWEESADDYNEAEDYKAEEATSTYRDKTEQGYVTTSIGNNGWTSSTTTAVMSYDTDESNATAPKQQTIKRTNDKIVKKGNVGIHVNDYAKDKHSFEDAIRKFDGYISNENERTEISRISNTMEIRLPNQNFDKFIQAITTGEGIKSVDYKRTSADDVGEEYYDLLTRIKTKKEVEKRYIDILRKAQKITDILAVEDQIRVIREEIESKEGRLRFLKDRISYSTVSLYIYQDLEYDAPLADRPTFFGKVAKAANTGWNMILNFMLFLIYIWPIVILLLITIILYKKKLFIFKKRK